MSEEKKEGIPVHGGLTPNQIEALKREHKTQNVFCITVESNGEILHFWFKKIDMTVMSAASKFVDNDPMRAGQIIFKSTLIKGSVSYADDVDVFPAVCGELMKTMNQATATLKKF